MANAEYELTPVESDLVGYRNNVAKIFLSSEIRKVRQFFAYFKLKNDPTLSDFKEKIVQLSLYYRLEFDYQFELLNSDNNRLKKILDFINLRIDEDTYWCNEILTNVTAPENLSRQENELRFIQSNFLHQEVELTSKVMSKLRCINNYTKAREIVRAFSPHLIYRFDKRVKNELNNFQSLGEITKFISNTNVYLSQCVRETRK